MSNQWLAEELHKLKTKKIEKQKVCCSLKKIFGCWFCVNIISKYNKGFSFILCVIDIFSKYTWVVL